MIKQRCKQCGEYKNLDKDGLCVFCKHGYGGTSTEKKATQGQEYGTGKAIKSAAID